MQFVQKIYLDRKVLKRVLGIFEFSQKIMTCQGTDLNFRAKIMHS